MEDQRYIANKAFQLESHNLDQELANTIDQLVDGLEITKLSEELKLILKLYLYSNYIKRNATTGMQVYNMQYCDTKHETISPNRYKLILMAVSNLCGSYVAKRYRVLENLIDKSIASNTRLSWLNLDNISMAYKTMSVLNFLVFLRGGKYPTIHERIIGIAPAMTDQDYSRNMAMNRVQMDFMYRETIWRVLVEFLTTIIPLVNTEQLKNQVLRFTGLVPRMDSQLKLSDKIQRESNASKCALCGKQPFNPYEIGCRHIFCYYCLCAKHLSDPANGYSCLLCKFTTRDSSAVKRYRIFEALT